MLTPRDFDFVFQQAIRANSPYFTLLARINEHGYPRLGFAIAKKQIKLAHDRNRLKRLARDYFRLHQYQLPAMDFILMARKSALELDNLQTTDVFEKLWHRFGKLAVS